MLNIFLYREENVGFYVCKIYVLYMFVKYGFYEESFLLLKLYLDL